LEGSLRVPFLMRWPGHIPSGGVSNEIVHEMDALKDGDEGSLA
jgi:arylsulfatase A-like enzyme